MKSSMKVKEPPTTPRPIAPPASPHPSLRGRETVLDEKQRIYHYANGTKLILNNVTELFITGSGNHRIKADNKLWIVAPEWIAIEIDAKEWTV